MTMMPSPFEMGARVSSNVMGGLEQAGEESALTKVLKQIQENPDPQVQNSMMNQILMQIAPERRPAATQMLQRTMQQSQGIRVQKEYENMATAIEKSNPDEPTFQLLANVFRSNIPTADKTALIKNLSNAMPGRLSKEFRLQQDHELKKLKAVQSGILGELKNASYNRKQQLQQQLIEINESIAAFTGMGDFARPSFDPNNPEHAKRFQEIDKQYKGNKAKVNAELAKEFK